MLGGDFPHQKAVNHQASKLALINDDWEYTVTKAEIQQLQHDLKEALAKEQQQLYSSLDFETRPVIPTALAAHYLNRKCQTLRAWACLENGPIRPVRINGRLAWNVEEIKRLLAGGL